MSETNGKDKTDRLDRIEAILERHSSMMVSIDASIERQALANEAAHVRFEEDGKRLLAAQILMNGAMQKMADGMQKIADGMISLELKMEETTGKLNALIETVDGIVRRNA